MFPQIHLDFNVALPSWQPPTGTDTMVKSGVSTSINTKHQCITAMKEYESKSLEVSAGGDTALPWAFLGHNYSLCSLMEEY